MGAMRLVRRPLAQSVAALVGAALVIGFLAWPMLFTSSGMAQDWVNHLWYVWRQGVAIERDGRPSLFLNDGGSVFYPLYAFYGGTIYSLAGALSVLLGGAPVKAYVLTYLLGFVAAYGGWYQLSRIAGLGRWSAQVPGLLFITSAYYLTLIYARGDWPEFIAVSMIPLLVAASLRVLLDDRLSLRWAILLVISALVLFGSHNITALWGVTMLIILGLAILAGVPQARRSVTRRGALRVVCLVIPAALVNAWYLFPELAYAQRTAISQTYNYAQSLHNTSFLVSAGNLFTFSRAGAVANTPGFALALPVLTIAWVLASFVVSLARRHDGAWGRALWILAVVTVLFAFLMTRAGLILALPRPYTLLQFQYRLESYVLLALSATVLATLVLAQRRLGLQRWLSMAGVAIVVIASVVGAVTQVDRYPRGDGSPGVVVPNRNIVFTPSEQPPRTAGGLGDYDDSTLALVNPPNAPALEFPPSAIRDDRVTISVRLPTGTLVRTNLAGAPYLVNVSGARVVGRDPEGHMVLQLARPASAGIQHISLRVSHRLPVVLGRLVTILSLLALALCLVVCFVRRVRSHRPTAQS